MIRTLLSAFLLLWPLPVNADMCTQGLTTGKVTYVQIGNRIELNGFFAIELGGLAAPNWDEPGAAQATNALRDMVLGKRVECELDGSMYHGGCVAVCRLDGVDIAEVLVRQGLARDCAHYSGGRYHEAEIEAAERGATISATYELPKSCQER